MLDKYLNKVTQGDCLELLKELPDKSVDLCLTDYPYGAEVEYDNYKDTKENLEKLIKNTMPEILRISKRALITTGTRNLFMYPEPDWILNWYVKSGAGVSNWGFTTWHPILAYGKDPYLTNRMGSRADSIESIEASEKNGHPCPKPINTWIKLLERGSVDKNDIILDPFAGSGTTAIASMRTNRNFICFEQSAEYCDIANKRIQQELNKKAKNCYVEDLALFQVANAN